MEIEHLFIHDENGTVCRFSDEGLNFFTRAIFRIMTRHDSKVSSWFGTYAISQWLQNFAEKDGAYSTYIVMGGDGMEDIGAPEQAILNLYRCFIFHCHEKLWSENFVSYGCVLNECHDLIQETL